MQIMGTFTPKAVITHPMSIMKLSIRTSFLLPRREASELLVSKSRKHPGRVEVPDRKKKSMNNIRTNCLSLDNSNEANMPLQKH